MAFPNFIDKHLEEALFHPKDFLKYAKTERKKYPKKYIIFYQKYPLRYVKRNYVLQSIKRSKNQEIYLIKGKKIGIVKINGIGAPNIATLLEELIALGGKEFISIGTAGGLEDTGVFLCTKAIRDEGTSHHYEKSAKYAYPDNRLTSKLKKSMKRMNIAHTDCTSWTTDAPYRETKKEINHYRKEGVLTVEMEIAALCAIAKYRKIKFAAALAVSDVLGKKWSPQFHKINLKKQLALLAEAAIKCFEK